MGAKKKEIKDVKAADLGIAAEPPALSVVKLEALPPRPPGRIIPGEPAEAEGTGARAPRRRQSDLVKEWIGFREDADRAHLKA